MRINTRAPYLQALIDFDRARSKLHSVVLCLSFNYFVHTYVEFGRFPDLLFYEKLVAVLVRVEHYAGLTISNFQLTSRQVMTVKCIKLAC